MPTSAEAGLPEFQVSGWNAIFAPGRLPAQIQAKLSDALGKALEDQATAKRAERTPEALQGRVEREVARWSAVLKRD